LNNQAKKPAFVPERTGGLDLDKVDTILVKFFFTNQDHVPRGIPHVDRSTSYGLDFKHRQQARTAGKGELGEIGRHREDRVDTGEPVFKDLPATRASLLKDQLTKAGFALKSMHWMPQVKLGRQPKYVVVCQFERGTQVGELPAEVLESLEYLVYTARWIAHVWDNSALRNPSTINFVGRDPNVKAKYDLAVEGGKIVAKVVPQIDSAK